MQSKKRTKRRYSAEFKQEAVALACRIGNKAASEELGVHVTSIQLWKNQLSTDDSSSKNGTSSRKSYAELEKEVRRLAKENGYLKEINKVLKKSTAIFSSDHMGNFK